VISTLTSHWLHFSWITDDAVSGFISSDLDFLNVFVISTIENIIDILRDDVENALNSRGTLMLVETKFEMHSHQGEIVT